MGGDDAARSAELSKMRIAVILLLGAGGVAMTANASADGSDPAAARAQLQQGFALKEQKKCSQAIPHFVESVRLDRQPKALLNLAGCEQTLGRLASAQLHFVQARDLAIAQGASEFSALAEEQIEALDRRMPKLVVRLAAGAPADTKVLRDGVELGAISLGTPLPIDPGTHTVIARGGGLARSYIVKLAESETSELEVTPTAGTRIVPGAEEPATSADSATPATVEPTVAGSSRVSAATSPRGAPGAAASTDFAHTADAGSGARTWVLITEGAFTAGALAFGIVNTLATSSAQNRINDAQSQIDAAKGTCSSPSAATAGPCADLDSAISDKNHDRNLALGGFIAAGAGGVAMIATALFWSHSHERSGPAAQIGSVTGLRVTPTFSTAGGTVLLEGRF